MGFFYPELFLWLPPALAGIIAVYLLKKRREPFRVPSVLLWEKALKELEASRPFKRLTANLMLILDLLIAALLISLLARPFASGISLMGRTNIIIIDTSASMKVREDSGTRFALAIDKALKLVDDTSSSDTAIIIAAGTDPRVIQPITSDKTLLRSALNKLKPKDLRADLDGAIKMASGLAMNQANSSVFLITDAAGLSAPLNKIKGFPLNFIKVGKTDKNMGITTLTLRRGDFDTSRHHALLRVKNFSSIKSKRDVILTHNGSVIDAREVDLEPGESSAFLYEIYAEDEGTLMAELTGSDAFDVDDVAFAILTNPEPIKVALFGDEDLFLQRAINITPGIELVEGSIEMDSKDLQVAIFDSVQPEDLPSEPGLLIINPSASVFGAEIKKSAEGLTLVDWDRTHPALRFVELGSVNIAKLSIFSSAPLWAKPIADSIEGPVMWAGEREGGQRVLCLGFSPLNSDWPLSAGFPIFIANSIKWLAHTEDSGLGTSSEKTGVRIFLKTLGVDATTTIKGPDGEKIELEEGAVSFRPDQAGVYEFADSGVKLAVNLFDESESDIRPSDMISTDEGEKIEASSLISHTRNEIWRYLTLAALALLMIEWGVYHRRIGE